jgi:hypothetical protein
MSYKNFLFGSLILLFLSSSAFSLETQRGVLVYHPQGITCGCQVPARLIPDSGYAETQVQLDLFDLYLYQNKHIEISGIRDELCSCNPLISQSIQELPPLSYSCGDMNGDSLLGISDIIYLINYLLKSGNPPNPSWIGDCNLDRKISLSDIVWLINYLFKSGPSPCTRKVLNLQSECLSEKRSINGTGLAPTSPDSILIQVIGNNILVTHKDAFYNCCAIITTEIVQNGYQIDLYEKASNEICDCLCNFDLQTLIQNLSSGVFTLSVYNSIGLYMGGGIATVPSGFTSQQSECKSENRQKSFSPDSIIIQITGNDLKITHQDAYYNCCFTIKPEVLIESSDIKVYEKETGEPCKCMCYFDLVTNIYDLPSGTYTISVYNSQGNYVGGGEAIIPSFYLIDYTQSSCLEKFTTEKVLFGESLYFETRADTLMMYHFDAFFNCAAVVVISLEAHGDTLDFFEDDTSSLKAPCTCNFNLEATVTDLPPGTYLARVWRNYEGETFFAGEKIITIEGNILKPEKYL